MRDEDKTKVQLMSELEELRQRLAETAISETEHKEAEEALRQSEEKYRVLAESLFDTVYQFDLEGRFVYANEAATCMFGYSMDEILNSIHVNDTMDEKDIVVSKRDINRILEGQSVVGERTFIRKDGTKFVGEVHSGPVYEGEKIVGVRGILRDITERKQTEHDLNERVKELECLYNIADIAEGPEITLNEIYQKITNLLPASWQYPEIACARISINDKEFRTINYAETEWKQSSSIKVHGVKKGVVEVNYLEARPELDEGPFQKEERLLIDAVAGRLGRITERMLAEEALAKAKDELEIRVKERTAELAKANEDLRREITERKHAEDGLRALSRQLVETQENERRAINRELHDQVGQSLTALGINLNIIQTQIPDKAPDPLRSRVNDSLSLVEQTTEQIRDVMASLRPPVLDDYGLVAALHWYGGQFTRRTGIAITVEGEEPVLRLDARVENALFRIAQEALTNVAKHSQATQVTVTIEVDNETIRLRS